MKPGPKSIYKTRRALLDHRAFLGKKRRRKNIEHYRAKARLYYARKLGFDSIEEHQMFREFRRLGGIDSKRQKRKEWGQKNKARINERRRADPFAKEKERAAHKRCAANATDGYIKGLIEKVTGLKRSQIPAALIEAKRAHLKMERFIKENRT